MNTVKKMSLKARMNRDPFLDCLAMAVGTFALVIFYLAWRAESIVLTVLAVLAMGVAVAITLVFGKHIL